MRPSWSLKTQLNQNVYAYLIPDTALYHKKDVWCGSLAMNPFWYWMTKTTFLIGMHDVRFFRFTTVWLINLPLMVMLKARWRIIHMEITHQLMLKLRSTRMPINTFCMCQWFKKLCCKWCFPLSDVAWMI